MSKFVSLKTFQSNKSAKIFRVLVKLRLIVHDIRIPREGFEFHLPSDPLCGAAQCRTRRAVFTLERFAARKAARFSQSMDIVAARSIGLKPSSMSIACENYHHGGFGRGQTL
jgi:hypothetical protein